MMSLFLSRGCLGLGEGPIREWIHPLLSPRRLFSESDNRSALMGASNFHL